MVEVSTMTVVYTGLQSVSLVSTSYISLIKYPGPRGFSWFFSAGESREAANTSREAARKKERKQVFLSRRFAIRVRRKIKKKLWDQGTNKINQGWNLSKYNTNRGSINVYKLFPRVVTEFIILRARTHWENFCLLCEKICHQFPETSAPGDF